MYLDCLNQTNKISFNMNTLQSLLQTIVTGVDFCNNVCNTLSKFYTESAYVSELSKKRYGLPSSIELIHYELTIFRNEISELLLIRIMNINYSMNYTTISLKPDTLIALKKLGEFGQSMDGLISFLITLAPKEFAEPLCNKCGGLLCSKIGTALLSCTKCNNDFKVIQI